jgi:phosphatidylglycerol:prolipoprotein diacylglycerol transferase
MLALAALAVAYGVFHFVKGRRSEAVVGGVVAAGLVAGRFWVASKGASFELSNIPIYSYGVMLGLSLVVGWYLTLGLAKREGLPEEKMANNYVVTAVVAVIGSRVLYILTNLDEFDSLASMFAMRKGGLVAYGGFLGGLLGSVLYLQRHKLPLLPWADVAVPSLASGLMITRIGCYLFGCDFGKPLADNSPAWLQKLGTFPHWADGTLEHGSGAPAWAQHVKANLISSTASHSLPVHPTQLYESVVGLALLVFLLVMRRYQRFRGQIFLLFFFAYGILRFILEIFRDDPERGSIPPALQEHLLLAVGLGVLALGWVVGFSRMVENKTLRNVTNVLAFVPAVVIYLVKRPDTFAQAQIYQLSTSQFIAIASGLGAGIVFNVLWKAAEAHPESAMNLNLPPALAEQPEGTEAGETDEDVEEERPVRKKAAAAAKPTADAEGTPKKVKGKKKKSKTAKTKDAGGDDGEREAS